MLFAFFTFVVAAHSIASAQEQIPPEVQAIIANPRKAPKVSDELKRASAPQGQKMLMTLLGIDPKSPEGKAFHELSDKDKRAESGKSPSDSFPLQHLRFDEGASLPSSDERGDDSFFPQSVSTAPILEYKASASTQLPDIPAYMPAKVIHKPLCEENRVVTFAIPEGYVAEGKPIDLLFFDGTPPFDVATGIGASTILISFGEEKTAESVSPFNMMNITCLPFRLRSSGKEVTYSTGSPALKNFDANPKAGGTFDPTVRKYLEQIGLGVEG